MQKPTPKAWVSRIGARGASTLSAQTHCCHLRPGLDALERRNTHLRRRDTGATS